ncbi:hypothetical protein GGI07_002782 [Coemansia sp. Benny D115]|nr:hypothetical protein GGI07_002782 [Coemansia sp. Benny D115]
MGIMNIAQPVNSKITGVSFSYYEPSEIRRMSVKQVVNPVLLDSLGNPTSGGLYDPAMGPFTKNHLCGTCSLSHFNCPGHFGHIELPTPVVNPMMFDSLYKFIQGCCPYCHHFAGNRVTIARFVAKFRLLEYGLVKEAEQLDELVPYTGQGDGPAPMDPSGEAEEDSSLNPEGGSSEAARKKKETLQQYVERVNKFVESKLKKNDLSSYKVNMVNHVRRQLIKDFISRIKGPSCSKCHGPMPNMRRDGYLKIFREPLNRRQLAAKKARNVEFVDVLSIDLELMQQKERQEHLRREEQRSKQQQENAMDEDDDEIVDEDESSGPDEEGDDAYDAIDAHPTKEKQAGKNEQKGAVYLTPIHLRNHLRLLFEHEEELVSLLFQMRDPQAVNAVSALSDKQGVPEYTLTLPADARSPKDLADMFFIEALPVPPIKFRPASIMNDEVLENPQNVYLGKVLKGCHMIQILMDNNNQAVRRLVDSAAKGTDYGRVVEAWVNLQQAVNNVMDSSKNTASGKTGKQPNPGIRQILEKKEGLFRQNMMGKRVNFAARSVISPDPNLESDEVGVPPVFAQTLTFPEPVTPHNVKELRQLVINGPEKWPGAVSVQHEDGSLVYLGQLGHESRVALANQLLTPQDSTAGGSAALGNMYTVRAAGVNKKVNRHLRNGDMVVMNRQPTLHRASMAGMRARVLPGERTLRFHYLNCNQFNSDFDGDEMNMHFPQSEVARSELRNIMGADMTYLNPTDGEPLRGLIQDSVDGGVIMTKRDTMFTRAEYQELIYWALRPESQPQLPDGKVQLLPPAIFKPKPLWTGKQVISTLLLNLTYGFAPLNLVSKDKIGAKLLGEIAAEEEHVLMLDGELLVGILDKSQFGASPYGLVHSVYELYSASHAGRLLSALGRLFLRYLQEIGFSCRMVDLLFDKEGDAIRKEVIKSEKEDGMQAALGFVGLEEYTAKQLEKDAKVKHEFQRRMEEVLRHDNKLAQLDGAIQGSMNQLTSNLISRCLPRHLYLPFPHNNMVVMTTSGAKGSNVNLSQITCCLGQQSLEGRRVPLMASGKSLPSFAPFESAGRAGGYVASRFLTGLKPQEFYFHCMAGREGLIDTAVKTSRSGYLQRCLIKHLEGIRVHYDYTVRDADGSVIQFQYGEDALDVMKSQHLTQFDFAATNYRALRDKFDPSSAAAVLDDEQARKYAKKLLGSKPESYNPSQLKGEPASSRFNPSRFLGAVSEKFYFQLEKYLNSNPRNLLREKKAKKESKPSVSLFGRKDRMLASVKDTTALMAATSPDCTPRNFRMLQYLNYLHSLIDPGESVGLIAAQGIGEPSTQMTLNTFHLAGFGAKNVTLGIPRLREIVMVASDKISAPIMDIPMLPGVTKEHAEVIAGALTKLTLGDLMDYVEVRERLTAKSATIDGRRYRQFTVQLHLFPSNEYEEEYDVSQEDIEFAIERQYCRRLMDLLTKNLKLRAAKINENPAEESLEDILAETVKSSKGSAGAKGGEDAEDGQDRVVESDIDSDEDEEMDEDDARAARRADDRNIEEPDESDKEMLDSVDAELEELDSRAAKDADSKDGVKKEDEMDTKSDNEDGSDDSDEEMDPDTAESIERVKALHATKRRRRILSNNEHIIGYKFVDTGDKTYVELELQFAASTPKFLMLNLAEEAVRMTVVREIPGISSCFVNKPEAENDHSLSIGTNGNSIPGIWEASLLPLDHIASADDTTGMTEWVDINHLRTNDIAAVLRSYGVEAARMAIVREINNVFGTYKITINDRHLGLVADYMTFEGGFKPFNRIGLGSNPSPLAKMSFESTCTFLQEATVYGDFDDLKNPSARIVMGQPVFSGTGSFDVMTDLTVSAAA